MEMVSLAERDMPSSVLEAKAPEAPYYPLSLHLDKPMIEKLSLTGCKIGDEKMLHASVRVTSISSSESERGEGHNTITLSLTEGAVEGSGKSQAEILYGDG